MQALAAEKIFTWARHNSNALRLFYKDMLTAKERLRNTLLELTPVAKREARAGEPTVCFGCVSATL
jgi:hypothetical protein